MDGDSIRRLAALMWLRGLSVGAVRDAGISFDGGMRHFCPRVLGIRRLAALMWLRGLSVGAVRDAGISFDGGRRHFCPRVTAPYGVCVLKTVKINMRCIAVFVR
ncbi:hypothetical protein CKA32_002667 [Geitlerinema sp. FC II]|nr:hypothetical protein CKA32_002667 [Geitlerinema sp. FC II]